MAVQRYKISLRVLKNIEIFFNTRREILYLQAAMQYSIYYIKNNETPNHFTKGIERCNFHNYVTTATVIFSRVKITCHLHAKAHLVFHWCLYNK